MTKVFKYGTGQEIPEGAVYLCTKVETVVTQVGNDTLSMKETTTKNALVWHYFLVEVKE